MLHLFILEHFITFITIYIRTHTRKIIFNDIHMMMIARVYIACPVQTQNNKHALEKKKIK